MIRLNGRIDQVVVPAVSCPLPHDYQVPGADHVVPLVAQGSGTPRDAGCRVGRDERGQQSEQGGAYDGSLRAGTSRSRRAMRGIERPAGGEGIAPALPEGVEIDVLAGLATLCQLLPP